MGWDRGLRLTAGLFALTLATAACVSSNPVVGPPPGAPGSLSQSPHPTSPRTPAATGPIALPGKTNPGSVPAPAYNDRGAVGTMARTYLRRSPASALTVEVDWIDGRDPSPSALDHLGSVLNRELDKSGISLRRDNRIAGNRSSWTLADLAALERANRAAHSSGSRATMWIGYVGGSFAANPNAWPSRSRPRLR